MSVSATNEHFGKKSSASHERRKAKRTCIGINKVLLRLDNDHCDDQLNDKNYSMESARSDARGFPRAILLGNETLRNQVSSRDIPYSCQHTRHLCALCMNAIMHLVSTYPVYRAFKREPQHQQRRPNHEADLWEHPSRSSKPKEQISSNARATSRDAMLNIGHETQQQTHRIRRGRLVQQHNRGKRIHDEHARSHERVKAHIRRLQQKQRREEQSARHDLHVSLSLVQQQYRLLLYAMHWHPCICVDGIDSRSGNRTRLAISAVFSSFFRRAYDTIARERLLF